MVWKPGSRLTHRYNPELGPGLVTAVEGRSLVVKFPIPGTVLRIAANSDAIAPLVFRPGSRVLNTDSGQTALVDRVLEDGSVALAGGQVVAERLLWPLDVGDSLSERLAQGEVDALEDFSVRLDALHLAAIREADGLGSFLGGRIRLFPHQLHAAESATRSDPVRWLLADEVGLGKTVEACLVLNHLLRTSRADRTLIVAPETLTVQWLGELWRKYHQVFVLLDDRRLADVEQDFGSGFNPFDAHRRVVLGLETLVDRPRLTEQAVQAGIDLLIVDEAHHLRRAAGHPGNAAYRAIQPVTALGRHVLLLTATPLEEDAHGFFRLLQLLRPEEFPEEESFEQRLAEKRPLPPCTSAARREEIGGLPPRTGSRIDLEDDARYAAQAALEAALRRSPAENAVQRKAKARRVRRGLASGAAVEAVLDPRDERTRKLAVRAQREDPRLHWLARHAAAWRAAGDKTLVFVAHRETLEAIKRAMSRRVQLRVGLFHEELSPGQRDIEVAQFRLPGGPSMLISTECGGEGRNFEFCTRLVLFDLPWNPITVEQRIGRLDRIGRRIPVEIVYFRPPAGLGRVIADLYEALGLFRQPLGGVERELAAVEEALTDAALAEGDPEPGDFDDLIRRTREAWDRVQQAAYRELHRDPYRAAMGPAILARVPPELEELTQDFVLGACEQLDLHVEPQRGEARYSIEIGQRARVEGLPGVAPGAGFLGTFDRDEACDDESIDFYASGHPLVEGLLAHLDESPMGRVALLHVRGEGEAQEFGLLALYKEGPVFEVLAVDSHGRRRPEWTPFVTRRPLKSRRVRKESWIEQPEWPTLIRDLAAHLPQNRRPEALIALRVG